jgi:transcriptional regulator with PAS, ATPase and Fis domain
MPQLDSAAQTLISYLEHEQEPMIVLDPDYNILAANSAYLHQFGVETQPPVGQKCYQVSHHYDRPCDLSGEHCPMKHARESRTPSRVLHIHHTPRGPEHVDVELRPIMDANGQITAYTERLTRVTAASAQPRDHGLVGRSEAFNRALSALMKAAPSQIPVLLQGESGTGKELFARALHNASPRASGPLVVVDCTGLSESLFESELFGHERGAFTGATQRKIGLAEAAHGGTLFLDEIGDVPLNMQVKLLRLIESSTFRRVGAVDTQHADFRLVAATHKPLLDMVAERSFRQDLYYRISAYPIHLPALRERADDIPILVDSLLSRSNSASSPSLTSESMVKLCQYGFPGNVRELRNILERATLIAGDAPIGLNDLPPEVLATTTSALITTKRRMGRHLKADELSKAAACFDGTRAELAAALGMSQRTLYRRLAAVEAAH